MSIDLTAYTDADLEQLAVVVNAERVRRANLHGIPQRAQGLVVEYAEVGGDVDELVAAVQQKAEQVTAGEPTTTGPTPRER